MVSPLIFLSASGHGTLGWSHHGSPLFPPLLSLSSLSLSLSLFPPSVSLTLYLEHTYALLSPLLSSLPEGLRSRSDNSLIAHRRFEAKSQEKDDRHEIGSVCRFNKISLPPSSSRFLPPCPSISSTFLPLIVATFCSHTRNRSYMFCPRPPCFSWLLAAGHRAKNFSSGTFSSSPSSI